MRVTNLPFPVVLVAAVHAVVIAAVGLVYWQTSPPKDSSSDTVAAGPPATEIVARPLSPVPGSRLSPGPARDVSPPVEQREMSDAPAAFRIPSGLEDALAQLSALRPGDEGRSNLLIDTARAWASVDPEEAMLWAFQLRKGENRIATQMILRQWAGQDPGAAFNFLNALEPSETDLREFALSVHFSNWGEADPAAAWQAAGSLTNQSLRPEIEGTILEAWAQSDPATAAAVVRQLVAAGQGGDHLSSAFQTISGEYGRQDPLAAAAWVESLPEDSSKSAAVSGLINAWIQTDPVSASIWLRDLPPGIARDGGIMSLVTLTRNHDPESAVIWARELTDPRRREHLTLSSVLSWLQADESAARNWIGSSDINNAQKERIFGLFSEEIAGTGDAAGLGPQ